MFIYDSSRQVLGSHAQSQTLYTQDQMSTPLSVHEQPHAIDTNEETPNA